MSDHSASGDGNEDISVEDEAENQVGDDYSSDKGMEEEHIPKNTTAEKKITIEQNEKDKSVATYVFYDEDHTLGNSLRYILSQRPDVEFCGYSIPHPSENKLNLRLQTIDRNSNDVMKEGLITLKAICDVIDLRFDEAFENFGGVQKPEKLKVSEKPLKETKEAIKKGRGKKK